jgi:hypothetical protein
MKLTPVIDFDVYKQASCDGGVEIRTNKADNTVLARVHTLIADHCPGCGPNIVVSDAAFQQLIGGNHVDPTGHPPLENVWWRFH